jgi:hypothetical protein
MGLLSKLFGSKKNAPKGPPEHEVVIHFFYGSTNYQHMYAIEDLIRTTIVDAAVGKYEGHEVADDGSEVSLFMYGPDAEALYRVISPVLAESPFMRGATVTLWFGPRKWGTQKRVIELPS